MTVGRALRIVCISDTHELHRELDVSPGDLLIHAGDFTFFSKRRSQIRDFNDWLGELPHRHKIVIPGNHESLFEAEPEMRHAITNATLLIDNGITVSGLKVWGSSVTPIYGSAFGLSNAADRKRHWARIPDDLDILVTHGPPFGILDMPLSSNAHEGCPELLEAIQRAQPRMHVFGHVHGAYGISRTERTIFVNAEMYGEAGDLDKPPIVQELASRR